LFLSKDKICRLLNIFFMTNRKFRCILVLLIFLTILDKSFSQNEKRFNELIIKFDTATVASTYKNIADSFINYSSHDVTQWVKQYYYALCNINFGRKIFFSKKKNADKIFDSCMLNAENAINAISEFKINNSEFSFLQYFYLQSQLLQIGYDQSKMVTYGKETQRLLEEMYNLDPNNPRYYFITAKNAMFKSNSTESRADAIELLDKSLSLFMESYKVENNLFKWGYFEALRVKKANK